MCKILLERSNTYKFLGQDWKEQIFIPLHFVFYNYRTVDASFQFYGQLEYVDFSYNQMTELPDKCFAKQSKLKHLQMDFNSIANITNQTFWGLKSLTHLSLRGNQLSNLDNELVTLTEVSVVKLLFSIHILS